MLCDGLLLEIFNLHKACGVILHQQDNLHCIPADLGTCWFNSKFGKLSLFLSSQVLGFRAHHSFQGPLIHLCHLEDGYGGVWAPDFGGATLGFEPWTSCLRVRSVPITLRGPPTSPAWCAKIRPTLQLQSVHVCFLSTSGSATDSKFKNHTKIPPGEVYSQCSASRCCDFARKWRILTLSRVSIFESHAMRENPKSGAFSLFQNFM